MNSFLLVKCVQNVPAYLAERLFKSMKVSCATGQFVHLCHDGLSKPLCTSEMSAQQNSHSVWLHHTLSVTADCIGHQ